VLFQQHSIAVNEWGQVFAWGLNSMGQCGLDNDISDYHPVPKLVKSLATKTVVQVACGHFHTLALTNAGEIYAFGANGYGQLGLGFESEKVTKPTLIKSIYGIPIAFICCGASHSFIVSKSGSIYGWGKNIFGQLGIADTVSKYHPTQLKSLRSQGIRYIACGDDFSVFLTIDGGVFTCGAGTFGQLGHGNLLNEILPRKVLELMGSTVTQISCGRRHTLTYLTSAGKIYGFGLNAYNQLGLAKSNSAKTSLPQAVGGPWMNTDDDDDAKKYEIGRIYAGGDHCLVSMIDPRKSEPDDLRILANDTQIWELTKQLANSCVKCQDTVDMEIMTAVEVIFKSLPCINGSFLQSRNEHLCCTSRNHGIDMSEATATFETVQLIENENLKHLIWESITHDLLSSMSSNPPDVEVLRIYLTLPLYHEFVNAKNYAKLHTPFCKNVLHLVDIPRKILSSWYGMTSVEYFERLVDIFKDVIKYFIHFEVTKVQSIEKQIIFENNFFIALNMLSLLFHINHQQRKEKVPYDLFHVQEVTEQFDIRRDYVNWISDMSPNSFYLCNYPFIFDANAKNLLLQTDQALQMHSAMQNAANQNFFAMFGAPVNNIFIVLNVSRSNLVEDTIRELSHYSSADLKKPLKVKFIGEEAEDTGGVRKEFFMLLLKDVLNTKYGMFEYFEESRYIWFAQNPFEGEEMYKLVGILCGLAIYNFTIINLSFPLALYKKLLNETPELSDLKDLSPVVWKSMLSVLDYQEDDLESVFCLNFEITRNIFGENKTIELKPNGSNIPVTQENKVEFVKLYVDYIFNKSVENQFRGFQDGFMKVCGGRVLRLFKSNELMAVIIGNEDYNWEEFEQNAEYKNGYSSRDSTIIMFWDVFHELSNDEKKKFLLFLTGSDRIPIQGMKGIKIFIQPVADDNLLPVAHVCASLMDLPRYSSKGKLKYKLLQAIQQTQGFSLV
jgi:E3 ubiquitin-protein ligase HERC4